MFSQKPRFRKTMSNQIYSNFETRSRYLESKPQFFVELETDLIVPTSGVYTEIVVPFTETLTTDNGYLSWDTPTNTLICNDDGVYTVQATVAYSSVAIAEQLEIFIIIDGAVIPEFGLISKDRQLASPAGERSGVLTTSTTFKGVPSSSVQVKLRHREGLTIQGVNMASISKRTFLLCNKIN